LFGKLRNFPDDLALHALLINCFVLRLLAEALMDTASVAYVLCRIEEAFSKMKALIGKAEARSREALLEAIGAAISALSGEDARGYFEHCGYRATVQPF
jgi:hypothetical protein